MNGLLRTLVRPWSGRLTDSRFERALRVAAPVVYMLIIFYFSSLTGDRVPQVADDRIEHTLEYFGFGLVLLFAIAAFVERPGVRHAVWSWIFGALYAASDEWHQSFVTGRDSSLEDLTFDTIGLSVALVLLTALVGRVKADS